MKRLKVMSAMAAATFLATAAWASYTDKDYHATGEHTYKHPNQRSYTSPFDYGPETMVEPAPARTGKCNCFTFDSTKSYDVDGQKLSVAWDLGDDTKSDKPVVQHCYEKAGEYTVTLTVRDSSGALCGDGMAVTKVNPSFPPVIEAGDPIQVCLGEPAAFDATASGGSGAMNYTWDFGDGSTGEGQRASHTYEKPGTYRVRVMANDGKGTSCSVAQDTTSVKVADRVTVQLQTDGKQSACVNQSMRFSANGTGGGRYTWDFGDGSTAGGGASASHSYAKPGTYNITVTADNGQGSSCSVASDRTTVTVYESPIADAGDNLVCCVGKDNIFDGSRSTGSGLDYFWDFGDGSKAEGMKVNHVYEKPGNYRVVLTVKSDSNSSCNTSSSSFVANVNTKPEAVIEVR